MIGATRRLLSVSRRRGASRSACLCAERDSVSRPAVRQGDAAYSDNTQHEHQTADVRTANSEFGNINPLWLAEDVRGGQLMG
jgi:hypothetical protein